jgi:hypothetical protein
LLAATLKPGHCNNEKTNSNITFYKSTGGGSCNGQTPTSSAIRPVIQKIANGIAKDNVLKSAGVGYGGVRTDQWERFEKLKKEATDEELKELTENKNPVVRCYSFQAIATRKSIDVFPILLKHLNDTARIETFQGCIVSSQVAGDYFLGVVTPEYIDLDAYKLTSRQRATVDSILLFDKTSKISAKYRLLSDLEPNPSYYNRIKEIATTENNPVAILALARFQNKTDIGIIKSLFDNDKTEYYAAYSSREFSDSSFYPSLTKIFEKEWNERLYDYPKWRILYQALAKYPTRQTYELFKRTTQTKDDFRYQTLGKYLMIAITKYPNEIFESLKAEIKLDEFHSDELKQEADIEK